MTQPSRRPFGTTPGGQPVELLILDNGTLRCELLTLGATLRTLEVPGRNGSRVDVVLGYDAQEDYLTYGGYLGAVVGRFANRIARGRFSLNGKEYTLAVNDGPNHLHGGLVGFSHRGWQVEELTDDRAVLSLTSPDGEEGYPGTLTARVTYRLDGSALELRYEAVSDKDTPCSLTNHSYFNLAGHASGPVLDQEICIHAQGYTPTDGTSIPLGTVEPVEGTPMDLRAPTAIGTHIEDDFAQLRQAGGYDHNYVVEGACGLGPLLQDRRCHEHGDHSARHSILHGQFHRAGPSRQGGHSVRSPPCLLPGDAVLPRLPQPASVSILYFESGGAV